MLIRYGILTFSAITALLGAWLFATELIPVSGLSFPRGDLWAAAAVARADSLRATMSRQQINQAQIAELRHLSERALLLAPHDTRMWLALAETKWLGGESSDKVAGPLKMSYYTGPHEAALFRGRQLAAAASSAFNDPDLADLLRDDLRAALRRDELRPLIEAVYRAASPQSKEFILAAFDQFAPEFHHYLRSLR